MLKLNIMCSMFNFSSSILFTIPHQVLPPFLFTPHSCPPSSTHLLRPTLVLPRLGLAQLGSAPHGSTKYGIQKPSRAIEDWLASHGSGSALAQPWLKSVLGNNIYKRLSEMSETLRLSIKAIISTGIKASSIFNTSSSFNSSKRLVPAVKVKL